ncbi:chromate transporter [Peredibacter starrii]|uniref:Chromate transporter n=1 Tax=Peredibacter starrii TaxID=28202 RepID=A0AAX4HVU0_9BACT|nr:chromate transporter [Peredibacter starrii]WPU67125.1 chromate transporter [Peredibacter starrii]
MEKSLAHVFLKLGFLSFGGPAAHIAMMRSEVVDRRAWLSEKEFMDLLGATNLIPGPNSTELAIFIGHKLAGWRGLIISGVCFILPAFLIVLAVAALYSHFGTVPDTNAILKGMRPVVVGVVFLALWKLGQTIYNTGMVSIITLVLSSVLIFYGINELAVIFGAGLFMGLYRTKFHQKLSLSFELFMFFFKVGSVLFGSGYVLLGFLQKDLVEKSKLLTESQLLDAITIGQVTPGPVFTTASFIGYLIDGFSGSIFSTLGIFVPSFIFVALVTPFLTRLRASEFFSHALDGVNAASLGLMIVVLIKLSMASFINPLTAALGLISITLLLVFKRLNSAYLIISGGALGYFFL